MHRIHRCLSALATGLFGLVTVQAAAPEGVLGEVQGIVLVSQGGTYTAAHSGMTLSLGVRVLTLESGSAVVTQADGCVTRLDPNSLFMLNSPSVCQGGEAALQRIGPYYASALTDVPIEGGAGGTPGGLGGILEDIGSVFGSTGTTAAVVGGGILAGIAGGIGFGVSEATSGAEPPPISAE